MSIAADAIPYAVALNVTAALREKVSNISVMPKGAIEAKTPTALCALMEAKLDQELTRVRVGLDRDFLRMLITSEFERLTKAVEQDSPTWKLDLPGRFIFNRFASAATIQIGRLKQLYLNHADPDKTFEDIITIFHGFRTAR